MTPRASRERRGFSPAHWGLPSTHYSAVACSRYGLLYRKTVYATFLHCVASPLSNGGQAMAPEEEFKARSTPTGPRFSYKLSAAMVLLARLRDFCMPAIFLPGFNGLWEPGCLVLTVEALVLDRKWRELSPLTREDRTESASLAQLLG